MAGSGVTNADESFALFPDGEDVVVLWNDISIDYLYSREWDDSASAWAGASWTAVIAAVANENTSTLVNYSATFANGVIYVGFISQEQNIGQNGGFGDIVTRSYDGSTWSSKTNVLTDSREAVWRFSLAHDDANDQLYAIYATIEEHDFNTQKINYKVSTDGMELGAPRARSL